MNYSNPILICDENEEFRILVRDMLTKNGFFHIMEASTPSEALSFLSEKKDYFTLIEAKVLTGELLEKLTKGEHFIVFASNTQPKAVTLAAKLGVKHVLSYPFHSQKLLEKMKALVQ